MALRFDVIFLSCAFAFVGAVLIGLLKALARAPAHIAGLLRLDCADGAPRAARGLVHA